RRPPGRPPGGLGPHVGRGRRGRGSGRAPGRGGGHRHRPPPPRCGRGADRSGASTPERLMTRRLAGFLAGVLLGGVYVLGLSIPAGAHALLAESTPADGATVADPPIEVLLTFTEAPDPVLAVVHVLDASGQRVESGKA